MPQEYISSLEAARRLGIHRSTMTEWLREGKIRGAVLDEGVTEHGDRWKIPAPIEIVDSDIITIGEAARYLKRSRNWTWGLVTRGIIKADREGPGKRWKVSRRSVEAYKRKQDAFSGQ